MWLRFIARKLSLFALLHSLIPSKLNLIVLDARVKVVRPGVLFKEFLCSLFDALIRNDDVSVYYLASDGAREDLVFVKIAVILFSLPICSFLLHLKVPDDDLSLKSLSALDQHRILHEVAGNRAEQVVRLQELFLRGLSLALHDLSDLGKQGLRIDPLLFRHFFEDLKLAERAQFQLQISQGRLLVLLSVGQVSQIEDFLGI